MNEEIEDSASELRDLESKDKDKDIAQPRQALFWGSSSSDSDGEDDKDGENGEDGEDDKDDKDGEDDKDDCRWFNIKCHGQKVKGKISGALGKAKNITRKIS